MDSDKHAAARGPLQIMANQAFAPA